MWGPHRFLLPVALLLLFRHAAYMSSDSYARAWRYTSAGDLFAVTRAQAVSTLCFTAAVGFLRIPEFPRSVVFIELALSILFTSGMRLGIRFLHEQVTLAESAPRDRAPVLILGAGASGQLLVKSLLSYSRFHYRPVALLDDDPLLAGLRIHGVPVVGTLQHMRSAILKHSDVAVVICAIPSLSDGRFEQLHAICRDLQVPLKRVQAFEDVAFTAMLTGNDEAEGIERILQRDLSVEHEAEIGTRIDGASVLVTGAGGSIGSELVRQLLAFKPARLTLFDLSEYNLFMLQQELGAQECVEYRVGSVCDAGRLMQVCADCRPRYVFHSAAYKHVPLLETNPAEAFANNALGTRAVLAAAAQSGAERFVLISSDKATGTDSVMGCSKRLAELLVLEWQAAAQGAMTCSIVRFGNVINSSGSVIPLFKRQISHGGPITVTDPEMKRYFMSIREAVRLVLTAGVLGDHGALYVLDMGEMIRIIDVAKKLLDLYQRPNVPIQIIGSRPGERLEESLTAEFEELVPTAFRKISQIRAGGAASVDIHSSIAALERQLRHLDSSRFALTLRSAVAAANHAYAAAAAGESRLPTNFGDVRRIGRQANSQ